VPGTSGWKGVGVGDAFGFGETNTSGEETVCASGGNEQAREIRRMQMSASRRGCFINIVSVNLRLDLDFVWLLLRFRWKPGL
jgi:hypothetical protein